MNSVPFYTFISILAVSLISLAGIVFLLFTKKFFERIQTLLVSFSIGSLLGGAILHLIPESMGHGHNHDHGQLASGLILISIVVFFVIEKYLKVRNHYHPNANNVKSFGPLNLIADGFHNFLDGVLIAAAYKIDFSTGFVVSVAVLAHELPQEIGDFAVLVQAGYTKKKALFFNFLSALASFLGAALVFILPFSSHDLSQYILPLAAGGFIYIALADLIPELDQAKSVKAAIFQFVFMLAGLAIMYLLLGVHSMHH